MRRTILTSAAAAVVAALCAAGCDGGPEPQPGDVSAVQGALLTTWSSTGGLTDVAPAFGARFGRTVSVSGDTVAVTRQPLTAADPGSTQVWRRSTAGTGGWVREFTATTPADRFPVALVSPSWLIVGEPCGGSTPGCKGRVLGYLWTGHHWHLWMQLIDADQAPDFGREVAWSESGTILAVFGGNEVRTYGLSPFSLVRLGTITQPSTPYVSTGFGAGLAIGDSTIAVGAPSGTRLAGGVAFRSPGFVYLFNHVGTLLATLTGEGVESTGSGPAFGVDVSMAISGNRLAVGAIQEATRSLTAYVFKRNTTTGVWSLANVIGPPTGATGNAISVAVDGFLAVTTKAANSAAQGTLRFFEFQNLLGPVLSSTFTLGSAWAPASLNGNRAIVGQPNFFGDVGSALTYFASGPVIGPVAGPIAPVAAVAAVAP